ncbi:MAG: hypothetical protein FWH21_01205 [Kiritimatiellaeota bacterium]|nr:hypothetical protein [Kiritimatiellota bacterium]
MPYDRTVYRDESLALAPQWTDGGAAIDTNGWTFVACWSTNGVQYWSKGPGSDLALTVTGDPFVWSPDMDCGARQHRFFIRAENPGGSVSYRANARFTMLDSPGFTPNALPMPVQTVDFATVKTINAPWLLPGALGGYATEAWAEGLFAKKADIPDIQDLTEADPVALPVAVSASNLTAKAIASALTTNDVRGIADGQDWFGAGKGISVNDGTGPDPQTLYIILEDGP